MAQKWRNQDRGRDERHRSGEEPREDFGYGRRGRFAGGPGADYGEGFGGESFGPGGRAEDYERASRWGGGEPRYGPSQGGSYDPYQSGGQQGGRYGQYGGPYGGRYGREDFGGRYEQGDFSRQYERGGGYYGGRSGEDRGRERGMLERAGDEVASWFGDEDAERRRRMDAQREGKHRGRGPKGYARSDERIREDVSDRLSDDPHIDASDIEVSVSGREVTLSGTVDSRDVRRRAEDCAEAVSGVSYVQNNLRVKQAGTSAVSGSSDAGQIGLAGNRDAEGTPTRR